MHRRTFLQVAVGAAVCAAAGVAVPNDAREHNTRERNYERFRQRLREIVEGGATISWCSLARPRNGSRATQVYLEGQREPLEFEQPWEGECI